VTLVLGLSHIGRVKFAAATAALLPTGRKL